jgi:apolipoprotein N-acyltransferase
VRIGSGVIAAALCGLGAVHTLAYSHTAAWPLAALAVALLLLGLQRAGPGAAAGFGLAYGIGWLGAGVWWLFVSMHRYGGLPAPLAAGAVLALASALSLYLALACALWSALHQRARRHDRPEHPLRPATALGLALAWSALWLMAELARGQWFTGFPWVASGYAYVDAPLAAWAPWVGVYGIGALVALATAVVVLMPWQAARRPLAWRAGWAWRLAVVGAVLGLPAVLPSEFSTPTGRLSVSLVQTNVAQDEKFSAERLPQQLEALIVAFEGARGQIVVAPETAVPLLPYQLEALSPGFWQRLGTPLVSRGQQALVGVPLGDEAGYTNSAVSLGGPAYRYDKHHLVPFGEFIPRGFRWFTEALNIPLGDFARGPVDAPSWPVAGQRLGPNICYEDLFGEELAVRMRRGADAPSVLVNLSNIGWFGDTVALPQHLNISRLRTLELQRPMLRSTNTGVTAVIDHQGRVTGRLPPLTVGTLEGTVEGRQGLTPYAAWAGRWGLLPLWLVAAVLLLGGALLSRRRPLA